MMMSASKLCNFVAGALLFTALLCTPKAATAAEAQQAAPPADTCTTDLLNTLFNRDDPSVFSNSYLALLLARYTYPTAFGISSGTLATQNTYQELYKRKWVSLGAIPYSITFIDEEAPVPVLGLLTNQPEAHAVVFATKKDVWVSFRGLTNVESSLTENSRFLPINGTFAQEYLPVHGGFYSSFVSIWPRVQQAIAQAINQTESPADARVYLTGHSMGSALAVFSAMRLVDENVPLGGIYLFGAPKMGQQKFIDMFMDLGLHIVTIHWWNELDMVPGMSPPLRSTTPPYVQLPVETLYRIWQGRCAKAEGITARECPLLGGSGSRDTRCRSNLNDHFAFTYVLKMQNCMLDQPQVAASGCLEKMVMATM